MNQRQIVLAIALAGAGWLAFFGDKAPDGGLAEPVARKSSAASDTPRRESAASQNNGQKIKGGQEPVILALQSRDVLMEQGGLDGEEKKLFDAHSWTPPPPPPPKPEPPPPPMAPPLPFTYLGKKIEDGKWEAYLAKGSQTFIVREQSILDESYRVDAIRPPTLHLTYLPLNQAQTLSIGGID